jgi:hypothetical protein
MEPGAVRARLFGRGVCDIARIEPRRRDMTQGRTFMASAAVIALTFGIGGQTPTPVPPEQPLSTGDIVIVTNDAAPQAGQTEDSADQSAKMGQEPGTHEGDNLGATPENDTAKIDQPARRNPTTGNSSGEASVQQ